MKISTLRNLLIRYGNKIGLANNEMILLWHLLDFDHNDKGYSYPTESTIAERMGLKSERNVRIILKSISDKKFLEVETRQLSRDKRLNSYRWDGLIGALIPFFQGEVDQAKQDQMIRQLEQIPDQTIFQIEDHLIQDRGSNDPINSSKNTAIITHKDIVRSPQNGHSDAKHKVDKEVQKETVHRVVDYLNRKLGTKYQEASKITANLIKARLADGFAPEDFKIVIDKKVKEWRNTEMEQYLRPPTLFGMKFESYLNQNGERHRKGEGGIIWDIPKEELMK